MSPDGRDWLAPPWLVVQRWAAQCACFPITDVDCPLHGSLRVADCEPECAPVITAQAAREGLDIDVLVAPAGNAAVRVCRHGRRFWIEPSAAQLRLWARNDTYGLGGR